MCFKDCYMLKCLVRGYAPRLYRNFLVNLVSQAFVVGCMLIYDFVATTDTIPKIVWIHAFTDFSLCMKYCLAYRTRYMREVLGS